MNTKLYVLQIPKPAHVSLYTWIFCIFLGDQHWILRYALIVHQENQLTTIFPETAVPDSVVTPGQLYTFTHDFVFNPSFRGVKLQINLVSMAAGVKNIFLLYFFQKSYIRLELHENWKQEFCLVIPVNVV